MPFSKDYKALIRKIILVQRRLLAEFPMKDWTKGGFDIHCWRKWRKLEAM